MNEENLVPGALIIFRDGKEGILYSASPWVSTWEDRKFTIRMNEDPHGIGGCWYEIRDNFIGWGRPASQYESPDFRDIVRVIKDPVKSKTGEWSINE